MIESQDDKWMQVALNAAREAQSKGEVPIGAVLVQEQKLIATGFNQPLLGCDPTLHAEMSVLREGAKILHNYRLINTTLYVTLEPCVMCLGAMMHARIRRLVYGCRDPQRGAIHAFHLLQGKKFNHHLEVKSGVLAESCSTLLKNFFLEKRER